MLHKYDAARGRLVIEDFAMNSACAAGTGSFLDQQASRLGVSIEAAFGRLAMKSKHPPRVAGRCSVFAKSDMIHLQQQATPDYDIIAGLCFALARNFISSLGRGKRLERAIAFQGGVAHNKGVVRAFEELLELEAGELFIPPHFDKTGALGAILETLDKGKTTEYIGAKGLDSELGPVVEDGKRLEPLAFEGDTSGRHYIGKPECPPPAGQRTRAYLGIDVGSISTNVVAIDEAGNVLAKRYLMTAGRPLEAVRQGLQEIGEEIGDRIEILGCGTTGSGRYLTGDFVGADTIRNEITAQATAAAWLDPEVDTIFEIGGQDSKYISLKNGVVVDFEMNHACAAGTGSFLEEQAERLGINIKGEFGQMAVSCPNPIRLGERCTVFMESDVVHHQARGAKTDELVSGLAYSIVHNYLHRVVGDRRIGRKIFLQGGTMANAGVVAAFEKIVGQPMIVPRHHDVTGAIGMALIARQAMKQHPGPSRFRGFDLSHRHYEIEAFECPHCSNACEIKKVTLEGEEPLYYGARCDRYNVKKEAAAKSSIPDLFKERMQLLMKDDWIGDDQVLTRREGPIVGIPRFLVNFDLMPFWKTFFKALGIQAVLSSPTSTKLVHQGMEYLANEPCFPVKVAHGHVHDLRGKKIDYLFLPSIINMDQDDPHQPRNFLCPYIQTIPYTLTAALGLREEEMLRPVLHFADGPKRLARELAAVAEPLRRTGAEIRKAAMMAWDALMQFRAVMRARGREILESPLPGAERLVVIVGRAYNTCDPGLNLDLPKKLRNLGACPVPMDMLPLAQEDISADFPNMYWKYGQRILKASRVIRKNPRLAAIYLTNFSCGPDSFISSFFKKSMGHKPFLQLELDEHSADAGVITRCEAFMDSLGASDGRAYEFPHRLLPEPFFLHNNGNLRRTLYLPNMCNQAYVLAAAFRACGVEARVLPPSDETSMSLGRRFTTGKECVPCVITAGDMIRQLQKEGVDPSRAAFFMPSGGGPCRFGNYNALHKFVLQEYGYDQVPIFAPNQDSQFYTELKASRGGVARLAWNGIVAVDIFDKLLLAYRPYEKEPGLTDRVYWQCLNRVCEAIEKREDLSPVMREAAAAFQSIAPSNRGTKPQIGIVGEIYVRNHAFSNQNLVAPAFGGAQHRGRAAAGQSLSSRLLRRRGDSLGGNRSGVFRPGRQRNCQRDASDLHAGNDHHRGL